VNNEVKKEREEDYEVKDGLKIPDPPSELFWYPDNDFR
jgi:hypothetical protein